MVASTRWDTASVTMKSTRDILREHGVRPTAQRIVIADRVLGGGGHLSAEEIVADISRAWPDVSRATVYNTLNCMAEAGLLRVRLLREGRTVYDVNTDAHHHFVDLDTGEIVDIPWEALEISGLEGLDEYEVAEVQVIVRGRRRS